MTRSGYHLQSDLGNVLVRNTDRQWRRRRAGHDHINLAQLCACAQYHPHKPRYHHGSDGLVLHMLVAPLDDEVEQEN